MALIKNQEESEIRKRYNKIIEQKDDWKSDVPSFLYDCLTEIRKKVSIINVTLYKTMLVFPLPLVIFGIVILGVGIGINKGFSVHIGLAMIIVGGSLTGGTFAITLPLILKKWLGVKKQLAYLETTIKRINSQAKITYSKDFKKIVNLFIKDGRSGFIAGAAANRGYYQNQPGYEPGFYNPVLGQQINDLVILADLFQEIDWEKLYYLYNAVAQNY